MKFTIKTIGCKVNTYESNKIKTELINAGLIFIDVVEKNNYKDLDFYIINTCSVTSIADKKSRQMIHQAKKLNEKMKIVATGCYNPLEKSTDAIIYDKKENTERKTVDLSNIIDLYIPNNEKQNFTKIFFEKFDKHFKNNKNADIIDKDCCENQMAKNREVSKLDSVNGNGGKINYRVREFIKIQDGCNQYCTYCIIPFRRGHISSRCDSDIIKEIEEKIKNGTKEIVLTGIHLSSFGLDRGSISYESDGAIDLARKSLLDIIKKVAEINVDEKEALRIRLGSLEPRIINDVFVVALSEGKIGEKFCANFCLSLQAGCDKTLKVMNRHYNTSDFENACGIIRKYMPYATITTDVIVGFPGETVADFEESLAFVKKMRFYNPNIFPYSKREGTKAADFENQVTREEKHRRAAKMIDECEKITKEIENEYNKIEHEILVEEEIVKDGEKYKVGYTKEYVKRKIKV